MMNEKLDLLFNRCPVIPVAVIRSLDEALPMLTALQKGGVMAVEITFRTSCAADAIKLASKQFPDMIIGAGTILNRTQAEEALEAGADIIMLDNMSIEDMREAVKLCKGKAETECSGNVTKENIARLVDIGVDYISSGALTHSSPILDLSLKNLHAI